MFSYVYDEQRGGSMTVHARNTPVDRVPLAVVSIMGQSEWVSMGLLAAAILIGSVGAAIAYQNGPPAMIGAFDFAYVGFAVI